MIHQFKNSNCWSISWDDTKECFEHLTECLDQHLGLVGDEGIQGFGLDTADDDIGVELAFCEKSGDQADQRPENLWAVGSLKYCNCNWENLI